ncbi:dipeptidase PepE [Nonlabens sp. Ci31]|uniref:dipeptidase PepE n=1 Tax=Nonlabens sp. Ci31 TaxID=2608253 RepID=UPI00146425AF|nr:dipeptidase PepE [Nonlabens sp. Ci31]QJP33393.1 dipeptidase PepE [Nonlabens sp. Ci31]
MKNMIIASTSTIHGTAYLSYLLPTLLEDFDKNNIQQLLFIPYARPGGISHQEYTERVRTAFQKTPITVKGIHEFENPQEALESAEAIFTGGGNTFVLVKMLHDLDLMSLLRKKIYAGTSYIGTSAGSNICGLNMRNTNDMPIVMPSSFKTTGAIGYNINAHYLDPDPNSTHMGETREQRIKEFHCYNDLAVVGLREGSYIRVQGKEEILCGTASARIFTKGNDAIEVSPGYDFAPLYKIH